MWATRPELMHNHAVFYTNACCHTSVRLEPLCDPCSCGRGQKAQKEVGRVESRRLALGNEYTSALRRLEGVAQKRGWGSILPFRELLQTLIPTRSADTERARAGDACPCMWKSERARV